MSDLGFLHDKLQWFAAQQGTFPRLARIPTEMFNGIEADLSAMRTYPASPWSSQTSRVFLYLGVRVEEDVHARDRLEMVSGSVSTWVPIPVTLSAQMFYGSSILPMPVDRVGGSYTIPSKEDIFGAVGPKCECGAEKIGCGSHSSWCPKVS